MEENYEKRKYMYRWRLISHLYVPLTLDSPPPNYLPEGVRKDNSARKQFFEAESFCHSQTKPPPDEIKIRYDLLNVYNI